jgi:two-component system, OmpR family, sensor histidine kinase QseC
MRLWPRPSLVGRVVLALLAALLLVWAVLVVKEYAAFREDTQRHEALQQVTDALAASLYFSDAERARIVVAASETQYNLLRHRGPLADPGDILLLLEWGDGTPVYASPALQGQRIPAKADLPDVVTVGTRAYWSVVRETPYWRLQFLEPTIEDSIVLRLLSGELLPSILIAFPLVLLPLWIAVRRGLRPLRAFAAGVVARDADDFSPLKLHLKHAELQPLATAFDSLLEKARQGIDRERVFVQNAAHELRTPLAVVAAQAHVLVNTADDEQRRHAQLALEQAVTRASHLVQQLLALATLEGGGKRKVEEVDLVALTREIIIAASPAATAKDIDVSLESPDSMTLRLDSAAFYSVLENLLANAIAYCPKGAQVTVSLALDGKGVRLRVADNGPGIASEELPRIFDRFYRGRTVSARGTGLGLAIVRQAVLTMSGMIEVRPGPGGKGAEFEIRWPLLEADWARMDR